MGESLKADLKTRANELGFPLIGIARAVPVDGFDALTQWLREGYAGEMSYMVKHAEARRAPDSVLPGVGSVIMVGMSYAPASKARAGAGKISCYAWGEDYHQVLRERLGQLLAWLRQRVPDCQGRAVVDTAPLLERDFARRAGLGWFGKNTMIIHKRQGSFIFLGALLTSHAFEPDDPFPAAHCGTCTACLDACPTNAFVAPYVLDARKCISYLTIELRGLIPVELRSGMGEWIFGCDVCQDVCPWNRKAPPGAELAFGIRPDLQSVSLIELLGISEAEFRNRYRGTALWRAKRRGLVRNAAIALGNTANRSALPALRQAAMDPDEAIKEAATWAIREIEERHP